VGWRYMPSVAGAHADDMRLIRCERLEARLKWEPTDGHETSGGVAVGTEQQVADFVRHDMGEPAMKLREVLQRGLANAVGEDHL